MTDQEDTEWVDRLLASASPWRGRARCDPVLQQIAGLLEGSLSGFLAATVSDHLVACATCAAEAHMLRQMNTDDDHTELDALVDPRGRAR